MPRLIASPADIGIDAALEADFRANPGAVVEVHEDVLRDLMSSPHPVQRRQGATGHTGNEGTVHHARRRTCV